MALICVVLDEGDTKALRIVCRQDKIEDQGLASTKVSTSGGVLGDDKQGDDLASEYI